MAVSIGVGIGFFVTVEATESKIISKDTFNRANASTLGMTDTGQPWQSYDNPNIWGIQNNEAYPISPKWDNPVYLETGVSNNVSYTITVATHSSTNQIFWRIMDDSLSYFVIQDSQIFRAQNDSWNEIYKIQPGLKSGDTVRVELRNSEHKVFVNNVLQVTFTDTFHLTGTKFGFSTNDLAARFDNLVIEHL